MNRRTPIEPLPSVLKKKISHFSADIVKRLKSEFFQPGDKILSVGTLGSKMYFLETGNVDVVLANGFQVANLRDGAYFGGT